LEAHDRIIEIACIVTDRHLEPLDDGVSYPIKTDKAVLDAMGEWCTNQHRGTGLTQEALNAKHSMREVEQLVLDYVRVRMPESGKALLAGSSVHVDKRWLLKDMPRLVRLESRNEGIASCLCLQHSHLHYRICDVSTIKGAPLTYARQVKLTALQS
jgi:oligoribonuclease